MTMSIKNIRVLRAPVKFQSPIRRASDTWDWIKPEDAIRLSLAAYYATCRRMERLSWSDGNTEGIDRFVFAGDLNAGFARRVQLEGFEKGICDEWRNAQIKIAELNLDPGHWDIKRGIL